MSISENDAKALAALIWLLIGLFCLICGVIGFCLGNILGGAICILLFFVFMYFVGTLV